MIGRLRRSAEWQFFADRCGQAARADIQIGFRATKVSLDRGGWFNPTPFNASAELQHLAPYTPVSHGQSDPNATDEGAEFQRLRTVPCCRPSRRPSSSPRTSRSCLTCPRRPR